MNYDTMTVESLAHDCFLKSKYKINEQDLISRIKHLIDKEIKILQNQSEQKCGLEEKRNYL